MGGLFTKPAPSSRITAHDKAVLDLKSQRDKLRAYTKKVRRIRGTQLGLCTTAAPLHTATAANDCCRHRRS